MDFEELHGKSGSGTNVGVDLTTLMTSQIAISTAGESGGGGSGSGDMTVPRIASFQVYWDVQGKQFKVFSPKVVDPSGSEIAVTEMALSRGTYVCEVKKNATTNVYTAAIKLIDSIVQSAETVTVVKLFKIEDGKVEQYHVGAIILGSKGESSSKPAAFDLEVSKSSTGTKTGKIVRCNFMFDGENKSLSDFSVSGSGSVYLVAKQPAPSGGMGDLPWTFEISESEGEAPEGGRVVNYKLYDLSDFAVTCDYRTTFMELNSPHKVARFSVEKYDNDVHPSVLLDAATEGVAEVRVRDGNGNEVSMTSGWESANLTVLNKDRKSVVIDPVDLEGDSVLAKFSKLTVHHVDGTDDTYYVLADNDIEISEASGEVLKDIDIEYSGYQLTVTKTFIDLETQEERTDGPTAVFTAVPHSSM